MFLARRRPLRLGWLALAAVVVVAGCGGSSSGGSGKGTTSPSATPTAATVAQIRANWVAFFDGKTPAARKIQLLENGQKFATLIEAQASSPLAANTSARVQSVTLTSATTATVTYTILLSGKPALASQTGEAVLQDGVWRVSDASFCALLALQNGGTAPSPCPAVSRSP
jgi:hypothetical protein